MSRLSGPLMLLVLASTFLTGNAWSQDKAASREREALRRSQQQVQQIRQEKTALEEKLTSFEQEKEKLAKQVNGAQARAKSESAKNQQLQQALDAKTQESQTLQEQKTELEQRLAELTAKQAVTERELAKIQAEKNLAQSTLSTRDQQVAGCEDKNVRLYQYGRGLIEQCRDRSASDMALRLEPFTGIKRVAMENLLEEYRDKLDAQKIIPGENRK